MKIPKRFVSLKLFFEHYRLEYVKSRTAKDLITKAHLYELKPFLKETMWCPEIDSRAEYSDKISAYWKITENGLEKLLELFPELEESVKECIVEKTVEILSV